MTFQSVRGQPNPSLVYDRLRGELLQVCVEPRLRSDGYGPQQLRPQSTGGRIPHPHLLLPPPGGHGQRQEETGKHTITFGREHLYLTLEEYTFI